MKDEREVEERYLPEIEELIRRELGLGERGGVVFFGWKVVLFSTSFLLFCFRCVFGCTGWEREAD